MIYYEKYGENLNSIIMFLHETNFVHCFAKQSAYFARKCQVIVPHLPGFGRSCDSVFSVDSTVEQIAELAESIKRPVTLVGFSLGAQLCLPLLCRHGELFNGAMLISPWLIKDIADVEKLMKQQVDNEKSMRRGDISLSVGLSKMERQEHKEFCKAVSMKSILAAIDNGIILEDYPGYDNFEKPVMAICGMKETTDIRKSVHALVQHNPFCVYDMWDGAGQNIPYKFAARLNLTIEDFLGKIAFGKFN